MQVSHCPECFAPIGGNEHGLLSTNQRDREMERILREATPTLRDPEFFGFDLVAD